jgi:hypothetical protein
MYVHDGVMAIEKLRMPSMRDALIEAGRMAPITAVFINSIDRHEDYAAGSMYGYVFTGEIVPAIERQYTVAAGSRAILGFSRSTVRRSAQRGGAVLAMRTRGARDPFTDCCIAPDAGEGRVPARDGVCRDI